MGIPPYPAYTEPIVDAVAPVLQANSQLSLFGWEAFPGILLLGVIGFFKRRRPPRFPPSEQRRTARITIEHTLNTQRRVFFHTLKHLTRLLQSTIISSLSDRMSANVSEKSLVCFFGCN